jgi:hypothetical protein
MHRPLISFADNEEGSVIVLSILVLVILTVIGLATSRTSTTEMQIVRNDGTYLQRFYIAESGAVEMAQILENEANLANLQNHTPAWLNNYPMDDPVTYDDMRTIAPWDNTTSIVSNLVPNNALETTVMDFGGAAGADLGMDGTILHEYAVIGLLDRDARGQHMIEIGYRKRF